MTVLIIETAPHTLRGELSRWMMEVKPGIFIAKLSAIVREALWDKVKENPKAQGALLVYSAPTETGFFMEMHGEPTRSIIDLDGLQLIKRL